MTTVNEIFETVSSCLAKSNTPRDLFYNEGVMDALAALQHLLKDEEEIVISTEGLDLAALAEAAVVDEIPGNIPVEVGTLIRIMDGPYDGVWKSTKCGWVRLDVTY